MLTFIEAIVFSVLLVLTIYYFFTPLILRFKLIKLGKDVKRFNNPVKRFANAITSFFLLLCSVKKERKFAGFFHIFILYGSLTFDTISVYHILEGFNKNIRVGNIHSMIADFFSITVIFATTFFIIKRYVVRKSSYTYGTKESAIIYALLITVTLTFLLYEGAYIASHPGQESYAFLGKVIAEWLPSSVLFLKISWWLHILNVLLFILYVPRSKYMHMFMGPINIIFKSEDSSGSLKPIDIENSETFGIQTHPDFTWKDILDGFACIDCGRCEDYCPASISGKALSPKTIITKMRDDLLLNGKKKLNNKEYQLPKLMENVYSDEEIWSCTTCGACMHVCPVENEHIPKIIGLRQSRVLMESKFPHEFTQFFKNMETNSNPWGIGETTRSEWSKGLDVKTLAEVPDAEILLWVGCAGSFDDRNKKVSEALAKILNNAGVKFAILGNEEKCCGDPARRTGNEYLFQMMAQENIETFKRYNIKKILTTCPHCLNTFNNEYPEVAALTGNSVKMPEVIHHSQFINELLSEGKLDLKKNNEFSFTYQDPCYLGRHNNIFNEPRDIMKKSGGRMVEMKNKKTNSFCCGGGGGLMWAEEDQGERINHIRTEEALETGADVLCTSCPYCTTMLTDGVKDKEKEDIMKVKDIEEIVAEKITL